MSPEANTKANEPGQGRFPVFAEDLERLERELLELEAPLDWPFPSDDDLPDPDDS